MQISPLEKSNRALAFGPFVLESDDLLRVRDKRIHLFPKQLEALRFLASRSGKVVTKDELLSYVWRDAFVGEGSLHQCISAIRRQLGEAAEDWTQSKPSPSAATVYSALVPALIALGKIHDALNCLEQGEQAPRCLGSSLPHRRPARSDPLESAISASEELLSAAQCGCESGTTHSRFS